MVRSLRTGPVVPNRPRSETLGLYAEEKSASFTVKSGDDGGGGGGGGGGGVVASASS